MKSRRAPMRKTTMSNTAARAAATASSAPSAAPDILYGLVRTDLLSLNPGKMAAQLMHAQAHANKLVLDDLAFGDGWARSYEGWRAQTSQGFGITLTLDCGEGATMAAVVAMAARAGFPAAVTHDPSYPLLDGRHTHIIPLDTCAWIFGNQGELEPLLVRFGLCP